MGRSGQFKPLDSQIEFAVNKSFMFQISVCKMKGCVIDTSLLPSGVGLNFAKVRSSEIVFVKIW